MLLKNINLEELRPTIPLNLNVILFSLLLHIVHCVLICFLVEWDTFIFNLSVLAQSVFAFCNVNKFWLYIFICMQIQLYLHAYNIFT